MDPVTYSSGLLEHPRELPDGQTSHFYKVSLSVALTFGITLTHSFNTFGVEVHLWDSKNTNPNGTVGDSTPTHCDQQLTPTASATILSSPTIGTTRQFFFPVDVRGEYVLEIHPHGGEGSTYMFEYFVLPTNLPIFP